MQLDRAVAHGGGRGGVGGGYGNIVVHGGDIGDVTPNCEGSKPLPLAGGVWGGVWRCQTLPAATSGTSPQVSLPLPQAGGEQVLLRRLLRLVGLRLALARFRRRRGDFEGQRVADLRSEEHTSELQSLMRSSYAVFCLKKKTIKQ